MSWTRNECWEGVQSCELVGQETSDGEEAMNGEKNEDDPEV